MFFINLQILPSMSGYYKKIIRIIISQKNFFFQLIEEMGNDHHDEQNTSFNSFSNYFCIKFNKYICGKYIFKIDFTFKKCIKNNNK